MTRLKYLPNTDWEGKFSSSAICWTVIVVDESSALHSVMTYCSMKSIAGMPFFSYTTEERYLTVTHSSSHHNPLFSPDELSNAHVAQYL